MKTIEDLLPHFQRTHEGIASLHQLMMHLIHREPQYYRTIVQLDTTQSSGSQKVNLPFSARFIAVMNPTAAVVYLAEGEPTTQPLEAIPVQADGNLSFAIQTTQTITLYWNGTAESGQNTVVLMFSDHPLPMQGTNGRVLSVSST